MTAPSNLGGAFSRFRFGACPFSFLLQRLCFSGFTSAALFQSFRSRSFSGGKSCGLLRGLSCGLSYGLASASCTGIAVALFRIRFSASAGFSFLSLVLLWLTLLLLLSAFSLPVPCSLLSALCSLFFVLGSRPFLFPMPFFSSLPPRPVQDGAAMHVNIPKYASWRGSSALWQTIAYNIRCRPCRGR